MTKVGDDARMTTTGKEVVTCACGRRFRWERGATRRIGRQRFHVTFRAVDLDRERGAVDKCCVAMLADKRDLRVVN